MHTPPPKNASVKFGYLNHLQGCWLEDKNFNQRDPDPLPPPPGAASQHVPSLQLPCLAAAPTPESLKYHFEKFLVCATLQGLLKIGSNNEQTKKFICAFHP